MNGQSQTSNDAASVLYPTNPPPSKPASPALAPGVVSAIWRGVSNYENLRHGAGQAKER